jgi:hypothetical protein
VRSEKEERQKQHVPSWVGETRPFHLTSSNITWNDLLRNAHQLHTEAVFRFLIEGILHGTFYYFLCGGGFSQWQSTFWSRRIGSGIR